MIVLDTHILLWWRSDPTKLSKRARSVLARGGDIAISAISCWEVAMLVERGRIRLDRGVRGWLAQAVSGIQVVEPDCGISIAAAQIDSRAFPGDPADRIIWATTRHLGGRLVTADTQLRSYAPSDTVW